MTLGRTKPERMDEECLVWLFTEHLCWKGIPVDCITAIVRLLVRTRFFVEGPYGLGIKRRPDLCTPLPHESGPWILDALDDGNSAGDPACELGRAICVNTPPVVVCQILGRYVSYLGPSLNLEGSGDLEAFANEIEWHSSRYIANFAQVGIQEGEAVVRQLPDCLRSIALGLYPPHLRPGGEQPPLEPEEFELMQFIHSKGGIVCEIEIEGRLRPSIDALCRRLLIQFDPVLAGRGNDKFPHVEQVRWRLSADAMASMQATSGRSADAKVNGGASHAPDFTWLVVRSNRYNFRLGNQANTVRVLWETREHAGGNDGAGLGEETIAEKIGASPEGYTVRHTFRKHPAYKTIIRSVGRGKWALFLDDLSLPQG